MEKLSVIFNINLDLNDRNSHPEIFDSALYKFYISS